MTTSQEQHGLPEESLTSMTESTSFYPNDISSTIESDKAVTPQLHPSPPLKQATPVPVNERIAALDVVRGFALIGIFLMNIEFFNRSIHDLGDGMPQGLSGANWVASFFVQYFIAGKFWTMFSLLFGMGFALMLTRANEKGQDFLKPYIRRVIALAIFGACHFIFIWPGDILFSYAATAMMLLVILFGKGKWITLAAFICLLVALIFKLEFMGSIFGVLIMAGILILFIRYEKIVDLHFIKLPFLSLIYISIGAFLLLLAGLFFIIPSMRDNSMTLLIIGSAFLGLGFLMARYHQPPGHRTLRAGIGLYCSIFIVMTAFGAYEYLSPKDTLSVEAKSTLKITNSTSNSGTNSGTNSISASAIASSTDNKNVVSTLDAEQSQQNAKQKTNKKEDREKAIKTEAEAKKNDIHILTKGSYAQVVAMRIEDFKKHASSGIGLALNAIALFLIGFWFVNIGIMKNTAAHLSLFKKMALWGLPIGIGMGLLGSLIATGNVQNLAQPQESNGYLLAMGLQDLFNLPACMGYVGLLVWMLHTKWASVLTLLAPFGRMALTNYLSQSLIASLVFYGYGFGFFGMGRAAQLGFVLCVVALQIMFSHLWLKYFRYGPLEYVWRAITYWKLPAMRNAAY